MQLWLDTANIEEIKKVADLGILDGVTTNPSLVSKENRPFVEIIKDIAQVVKGPVSAEVVATDTQGMYKQGLTLAKIAKNVVVKLPAIVEALPVIDALAQKKIKVNCTLTFSVNQGWLAAKAGAAYINAFVGRVDDVGDDGMRLAAEHRDMLDNFGYDTKLIVASVRHPQHVQQALLLGADVCTLPYGVFEKLMFTHQTEKGLQNFLKDWEKIQERLRKI